ncbi:heat shock protein Hsp70-6 [Blastocladiella britannica]|nr:heat shock protein Hsp70-6 [Blastocladiella britannica]
MPPKRNAKSAGKKPAAKKPAASTNSPKTSNPSSRSGTPAPDASTAADVEAKTAITVAFSLGSEYATFTLLPTEAGQRGEVIANEDGERQIPAVVAIAGTEEIAGTAAKAQMIRNLSGTARRFVPLIGLGFNDAKVKAAAATSVVPIEQNEAGEVEFVLTTAIHSDHAKEDDEPEVREVHYTPQALTAVLLRTLKQSAESYTGSPVGSCVLSYPTDFTVAQQEALVAAAADAGMSVTSLIPEPVAAALAFEHYKRTNSAHGCNGLVVALDAGATQTTITLLNVFAGLFSPIAHTTVAVGGTALDEALAGHFAADFAKRNGDVNPMANKKAAEKLRVACETTRKVLSQATTANCHVESFFEGIDYVSVINRSRFEMLAAKWKKALNEELDAFFDAQNVDVDEVDHVLVLGGLGFTPFVQRMLADKFGRATIETEVDPDEAVAYGAAIHALQPANHHSSHGAEHADREAVVPHLKHALGVLDAQGHFVTVIPRDTAIPVKHAVAVNDVDAARILVKIAEARELHPLPEGDEDEDDEEEDVPLYKGTLLGELPVVATDGKSFDKVELVFTVAEAGKLHVSATGIEKGTGHKVHVGLDL